jgi:hypothetical protein
MVDSWVLKYVMKIKKFIPESALENNAIAFFQALFMNELIFEKCDAE